MWRENVPQVWQTHGSASHVSAVAAAAHVVLDPPSRMGRQAPPAPPLPRPPLQVRPQQTLLEDQLEEGVGEEEQEEEQGNRATELKFIYKNREILL